MLTVLHQRILDVGRYSITSTERTGRTVLFLMRCFSRLFAHPFPWYELLKQIRFIGAKSLLVVLVAGLFSGMVIALQFYDTLVRFGSVDLLGSAVALSLIRELGPVLTALMVIGRAGSSICAEMGIMRNEQQFDALDTMGIDVYRFVMLPRLLAALVSMPLLTAIFDVIGIGGGYIVGVLMHGVSEGAYIQGMIETLTWADVRMGFLKSILFGLVMIWLSLANGFYLHLDQKSAGAERVSSATTQAVVHSAILMLFLDFIISSFLL